MALLSVCILLSAAVYHAGAQTTPYYAAPSTAGSGTTSGPQLTEAQKVVALIESIATLDPAPLAFINPAGFIQHNLDDLPGIAGVGDLIQRLNGTAAVHAVRSFQDGLFAWAHSIENFFGPKIGFDVFRFDSNNLIVEHWDNLQVTAGPNQSGHNMTDGPITATDLDKTEANRAVVTNYVNNVLIAGQNSQQASFFNAGALIQHNPFFGDGVSGLNAGLAALAAAGTPVSYTSSFKVLAQGNFVLSMASGLFGPTSTAYYDLFRVENGFIAEQWPVAQTIPPQSQWKNPNGKYICPAACVGV